MARLEASTNDSGLVMDRRLRAFQIFSITFGAVVGLGIFRGSSVGLGVSGPVGAIISYVLVGLIAIAVMDGLSEMICIWPIPNSMVEFVKAFVDEDVGIVLGLMYCFTFTVTASALIAEAADLLDYWDLALIWKIVLCGLAPLGVLALNCFSVWAFGFIELVCGILKLVLILGVIVYMFIINRQDERNGHKIATMYIVDNIEKNENAATTHGIAVLATIPTAIFSYIGVEAVSMTAFEARDAKDLKWPARMIAPTALVLYGLTTGLFVSNVAWTDQNLPRLFNQALTSIKSGSGPALEINSNAHAAPLIALLRSEYQTLPKALNICLILVALSTANTAMYVASRQLYGLTRNVTIGGYSGPKRWVRKILAWVGGLDIRTLSPWPAIIVCTTVIYWLPLVHVTVKHRWAVEIVDVLDNVSSVSALLVWMFQCIAYISFHHWRSEYQEELRADLQFREVLDKSNAGPFHTLQPAVAYFGAVLTFLVVFFVNTASMWNGEKLRLKLPSAAMSPVFLISLWILKRFSRPSSQWRQWRRFNDWKHLEATLQKLKAMENPHPVPAQRTLNGPGNTGPPQNDHRIDDLRGSRESSAASSDETEAHPAAIYGRDNLRSRRTDSIATSEHDVANSFELQELPTDVQPSGSPFAPARPTASHGMDRWG